MPCFDIDGNPVACAINGAPNPSAVTGYGLDYEQVKAAATRAPSSSGAPDAMYDSQGRYYEYVNGKWTPNPQFDDPTQAAGYQAPKSYAPQYPTTEITPTGDIYTINPYTGIPTYMGNDPRLATGLSPSQQRSNEVFDTRQARDFEREILGNQQGYNTSERLGSQTFQTSERLGSEQFTAGQNDLNRALTAGQFASNLALSNEQNRFTADQAYQQARERYTAQQLGAAQQVADNISNIDPGALPAFYAAGGGNIANALASGATGQTDAANLGSARALMAAEMAAPPERFTFTPATFDPRYGMETQQAKTYFTPPKVVVPPTVQAPQPETWDVGVASPLGPASSGTPENIAAGYAGMQANAAKGIATAFDAQGNNWAMENGKWVKAADGGQVGPYSTTVVGDPRNGSNRPNPEVVQWTPQGNVIVPLDKMGMTMRDVRGMPKAADGGVFGTQMFTAADLPYLQRIRDIRTNVDYNRENPYDVGFENLAPSLQQRFYAGRQTQYGIPVQDQMAEQQRYRLQGASRGAFALGV